MSGIMYFFSDVSFIWELFLSALIFLLLLEKRVHWKRNYLCSFLISTGVMYGFQAVIRYRETLVSTDFLMTFMERYDLTVLGSVLGAFFYILPQLMLLSVCFRVSCSISWNESIYGALCAYITQHLAYNIASFLHPKSVLNEFFLTANGSPINPYEFPLLVVLGFIVYHLVARPLAPNGHYRTQPKQTILSMVLVISVAVVLNLSAKLCYIQEQNKLFHITLLYDMLCCIFLLWHNVKDEREANLRSHIETERRLRFQQQEQYTMSRESIAAVNRKCHDLKHQIAALRTIDDAARQDAWLEQLESTIMIYDACIKTGNEVLDTVLSEKSILCERDHIRWTCMADGTALAFMDPIDLYTLFGNALDNAMECACTIEDPEKRHIAVTLHRQRSMAFLQIENFCDHALRLKDGVLCSTKPEADAHGFGTQSIQRIADQYHGQVNITCEDGIFLLSILLPIPN